MTLAELKELARKNKATCEIDSSRLNRRVFNFKNQNDMWMFIDDIEDNMPEFKLCSIDHANSKIYIDL